MNAIIERAESVIGAPFEWGKTNCVALGLFIVGGEALRQKYSRNFASALRAAAWCRHRTAADLAAIAVSYEGFSLVESPAFGQTGDLILIDEDDTICCHAVVGGLAISSTPARGVFIHDLAPLLDRAAVVVRPPWQQ